MSARDTRIQADIQKIKTLSEKTGGKVQLVSSSSSKIKLSFKYKTVKNSSGTTINSANAEIVLSSRYPFAEPSVKFLSQVFHPNVYDSGQVCLGTKWLPTEGLDLLVERLIKILIFDATILNTQSPASSSALNWYRKKADADRGFFPTDTFNTVPNSTKKKIQWGSKPSDSLDQKIEVKCSECGAKMRVPSGKKLKVTCPKCNSKFEVVT